MHQKIQFCRHVYLGDRTFLAHIFRRYKTVSRIYSGPKTFLVIYIQEIGLSQSQIFRRFKMVNLIYSGVKTFIVIHIQEIGLPSPYIFRRQDFFSHLHYSFRRQHFLRHRHSIIRTTLAVDIQEVRLYQLQMFRRYRNSFFMILRRQGLLCHKYSGDRTFQSYIFR